MCPFRFREGGDWGTQRRLENGGNIESVRALLAWTSSPGGQVEKRLDFETVKEPANESGPAGEELTNSNRKSTRKRKPSLIAREAQQHNKKNNMLTKAALGQDAPDPFKKERRQTKRAEKGRAPSPLRSQPRTEVRTS